MNFANRRDLFPAQISRVRSGCLRYGHCRTQRNSGRNHGSPPDNPTCWTHEKLISVSKRGNKVLGYPCRGCSCVLSAPAHGARIAKTSHSTIYNALLQEGNSVWIISEFARRFQMWWIDRTALPAPLAPSGCRMCSVTL